MKPLSRSELARKVARSLPRGAVVNLGIGLPVLVSSHVTPEQDIVLQSENGILSFVGLAEGAEPDLDLVDAAKRPIQIVPGTSFMDTTTSFGIMRGRHLDVAVLGAFEVSVSGDLANWWTGKPDDVPGVGGAMDLACGAPQIWAMMEHTTKDGQPKVVERCAYPLTARAVVTRIFTDLATIDVTPAGLVVIECLPGLDRAELQNRTAAPLTFSPELTSTAAAAG